MAKEISIGLFEKNAKIWNKKGLRRSYASFSKRTNEYLKLAPLGSSSKYVIEVVVDKDFASKTIELLKSKGFEVLGAKNYYHSNEILVDYENNKKFYPNIEDKMEELSKEYESSRKCDEYEIIENDDARFYFLPYNDKINNLCEFIEEEKNNILNYAKENDITIIMNIKSFVGMLTGYFGFNYIDAQTNDDTEVDYSSEIVVKVDINQVASVYVCAILLEGITPNSLDLELMNVHIAADNLKYEKE